MRIDYYHILVVMLKAMTKFSLSCEHTHTTWEDRTDAASSSAYSRVPTIIITSNSMNGQGNVKNWYVIVIWFSRASSPMEVQLMIGIATHASEFPCSTPEFQLTTLRFSIIQGLTSPIRTPGHCNPWRLLLISCQAFYWSSYASVIRIEI